MSQCRPVERHRVRATGVNSSKCATLLGAVLIIAASAASTEGADRLPSIEIEPQVVRLFANGGTQQLLITGREDDGIDGDLSRQTLFESLNADVADVSETGLVRARNTGETAIRVSRFQKCHSRTSLKEM